MSFTLTNKIVFSNIFNDPRQFRSSAIKIISKICEYLRGCFDSPTFSQRAGYYSSRLNQF